MSNIVFAKSENLPLNKNIWDKKCPFFYQKLITLSPSHCTGFVGSPFSVSTSFAGAFEGSNFGTKIEFLHHHPVNLTPQSERWEINELMSILLSLIQRVSYPAVQYNRIILWLHTFCWNHLFCVKINSDWRIYPEHKFMDPVKRGPFPLAHRSKMTNSGRSK